MKQRTFEDQDQEDQDLELAVHRARLFIMCQHSKQPLYRRRYGFLSRLAKGAHSKPRGFSARVSWEEGWYINQCLQFDERVARKSGDALWSVGHTYFRCLPASGKEGWDYKLKLFGARVLILCENQLRWPSWAPVPNKPTVSADVKQHSTN